MMKNNMPHGSLLLKAVICNITYYSSRVLNKLKVLFSDEDAIVTINPSEVNGRSNMELQDCSLAFKLEHNTLYQYARYGIVEEGVYILECKEELTDDQMDVLEHNIDQKIRSYKVFGSDADAIYENLQLLAGGVDIDADKDKVESAYKRLEDALNEVSKYGNLKDYLEAKRK